jgi:diguanylate cyclase (GGDEF)-like protein
MTELTVSGRVQAPSTARPAVRESDASLERTGRRGSVVYLADTSRGLPSNQVHRLARDDRARLWLASPVGLARFDGSFIECWDRGRGLQCNGLRTVAVDAAEHTWIGTDLGLELLDAGGRVVPDPLHGDWRFGLCQDIVPDAEGAWVGTAHGLVRVLRDAAGLADAPGFVADIGFVNDVLVLPGGRVLAASSGQSLVETDGRAWWTYRCEGLVGRQVTRIAAGHGGQLLVATNAGLHVLDDRRGAVLARLTLAGVNAKVGAIACGADRYWAAFGRIVAAFSLAGNTPRLLEWFEVESPVNDLATDDLGNVWLGTNNSGLAQVSCLRDAVHRIDLGPGGAGGIFSIKPGPADALSIGGEQLFGTVTLRQGHEATPLESPPGLPETVVWDSLHNADGTWLATQAGLFRAPPGGAFEQVFASDLVLGAPCRVLLERDGDLWVGTLRGLARIRAGVVEPVEPGDGALGYIYMLRQDRQGALWIGTLGRGLWRERDGLQQVAPAPLTARGNTYAWSQSPEGRIAVVQDSQVVELTDGIDVRPVIELPPVAGWAAAWIDEKTLALGASDGLRVVDMDSGRVLRHVRSLMRLRDWEFTNNRTLLRDPAGAWLCGLSGGLVRVDLRRLQSYPAPEVHRLDVAWNGTEPETLGGELQVRPGRWTFHLRAYCAWFVDSTQVQVQFQLVGFDADWQAWQDSPEIAYNSLPPGHYRLVARARSPLTGNGPTVELLRLHVRRPLWAMGWSAALAAVDTVYDQLVRSRHRNRDLLQTNLRLEQEVADRTERLRASNQQLLALRDAYQRLSEVDALTGVGNRRSFDKELARCLALARRTHSTLALLMVDVDHFKAVNDRHGHQAGDDYLRAVGGVLARTVRSGEDVASRYGGEEFALLLQSTDADGARVLAERVRQSVEVLRLPNDGAPGGSVTVSIGVAVTDLAGTVAESELVARADRALYRAKREGRNRVVLDDPSTG